MKRERGRICISISALIANSFFNLETAHIGERERERERVREKVEHPASLSDSKLNYGVGIVHECSHFPFTACSSFFFHFETSAGCRKFYVSGNRNGRARDSVRCGQNGWMLQYAWLRRDRNSVV